ncbi:MAG: sulfatase-like hydrolase/transferase [Candidatus Micrarchaeaceae archaeon]
MIEKPNIIFVMLDTMRADYLKMYSGSLYLPVIENVAKNGVIYENAIAPGTYTAPSHASLFLGKRVKHIKIFSKDLFNAYDKNIDPFVEHVHYLTNTDVTVAAKLKYLGYKTALFSNNPFLSRGTNLANGFDYVNNIWLDDKIAKNMLTKLELGIVANKNLRSGFINLSYMISRLVTQNKLDELYLLLKRKLDAHFAQKYGFFKLDAGARKTNAKIKRYVEHTENTGNFIFVNYMEGHEGYPTNLVGNGHAEIDQEKWLYLAGLSDYSGVKIISKAYEKRLAYLDSKVGELLSVLKSSGILDNAVLILASDHGQAFAEHGLMYHNMFPFQELAHVPLITARFIDGKQVHSKERVEKPVSLSALHQSILDIGTAFADDINGNLRADNFVFSEHVGITEFWDLGLLNKLKKRSVYASKIYAAKKRLNTFATAVYYRGFKLIIYKDKRLELYDLKADPGETENIISRNRSIAHKLLAAEHAA